MYEGQFNKAGIPEPRETADLQRFRWTELVARLTATRDLRDEMARIEGSFGAFTDVRRLGEEKGKEAGNHAGSGHGKSDALGLGDAANDAVPIDPVQGDRETK